MRRFDRIAPPKSLGEARRGAQMANWRALQLGTQPATLSGMIELLRTNDAVVISFVQSLLRDAGIDCLVADQNMSVLDGSIGILPRRILVPDADATEARAILADAGIANEIREG